jgi:hypothetical protein
MTSYKSDYDSLNAKSAAASSSEITSSLSQAMDQISVMTEKKKRLEMHVQTATKMYAEIRRRSIDKLQDFEEELMTSGRLTG